jgi:hypothetical protein
MSKHGKTITILACLAFAAFLLWTTLSAQNVECEVCVEFNGERNCAVASHENEAQAVQSAQTTACGPLARGMNDVIACGNRPPVKKLCRTT